MAASAVSSVSVRDRKILLVQDGQKIVLAPNGQDESYYWVSLSPDGSRILYSSAYHGTNICDLQGHMLLSIGLLNAPKWLDNNRVAGMQEHYSAADPDVVDYTEYFCVDLHTLSRRPLTEAETQWFLQQESARKEAMRARHKARAVARRSSLSTPTGLTGLKIYVNPGHGGHDSDDRSCWTIPVPETWTNPNGYWESNSNLTKGLALRDLLVAAGATVIMSRTTNTTADDRALSAIAEEANANSVDHFLSIHSNAINGQTNYVLELYRGTDGNPTTAGSDDMAASAFNTLLQNPLTVWTSTETRVRGDISFYPSSQNGLGVLRPLTVPGFLSEGSFHDYAPETHRLCNANYCKLEALRFFQHIHHYFGRTLPQTATISGWVKSQNEKVDVLNQKNFYYKAGSDDQWLPLNGAKVVLIDANDHRIDSLVTDDWYNGIFAFYDLQPGTYTVEASLNGYKTTTQTVTVAAEEIAGVKMRLRNVNIGVSGQPNIYASGLSASQGDNTIAIHYVLNAPATSLKVKFYNGTTFVSEVDVTEAAHLTRGEHSDVVIDLSSLPKGTYTWALEATAEGHSNLREVLEQTTDYAFYGPRDVAVDNSPESHYFGRVYVANGQAGTTSENGVTRATSKGMYIFDALMNPENATAYTGGISWAAEEYLTTDQGDNPVYNKAWGPYRLAIDEDGYVYITDNGAKDSNSTGVYRMNPATPSATFVSVLGKANASGLFRRANSIAVSGKGASRVLYLNDWTDSIVSYPIGNNLPCTSKGATMVKKAAFTAAGIANAQNSLARDNNGGFWVSQVALTADRAQLAHFNAAGTCDFRINNTTNSHLKLSNSRRGAVGLNPSNSMVAFGGGGTVKVLSLTNGNASTAAAADFSMPTDMGTNVDGIAFDVADNIYVVSASTERLRVFATPKTDNSHETPAPASSTVERVIHVTSVELDPTEATILKDASLQLTANVLPADANDKSLSWESSNPAVATVSESGLVTAIAPGEATITVTTNDQSMTATCEITVPAYSFELNTLCEDLTVAPLTGKTVRRVVAKDRYLFVLALDAQNEPYLYRIDTRTSAVVTLPTGFCSVVDANGLKLSDIAVTTDGVLVGCNKEHCTYNSANYPNGHNIFKVYKWTETDGNFTGAVWLSRDVTAISGNWAYSYTGETMTYVGSLASGRLIASAWNANTTTAILRFYIADITNAAVTRDIYNKTSLPCGGATAIGQSLSLKALQGDSIFMIDGNLSKPYRFKVVGNTSEVSTTVLLPSVADRAQTNIFAYDEHTFALSTRYVKDSLNVGFVMNDIRADRIYAVAHNAPALPEMQASFAAALAEAYQGEAYVYMLRDNKMSVYTTGPAQETITVGEAGYATYYNSTCAYSMPADMIGYPFLVGTGLDEAHKFVANSIVPANTPLVLEAAEGTYELDFTVGGTPLAANDLLGTDAETNLAVADADNADYYYYGLSLNSAGSLESVGFYWLLANGAAFENGAHKAYLRVAKPVGPNPAPQAFYLFNGENNATELSNVEGADETVKFMRDGKVYILRNGVTYDALGRTVDK